jgi:hypothetical protein
MVLARLSTTGMRVSISKSKFFAEQIEYLGNICWFEIIEATNKLAGSNSHPGFVS